MVITPYNNHCWLLSPGPWLVGTTKAYSGVGADIVMESLHSSFDFRQTHRCEVDRKRSKFER